jgi:hypothetical protein
MLVIDGQVVREGQSVKPGLVLQRIGAREAILAWGEEQFVLPY